ncbi:MAG: monomethylamine:corrinoid methyltransferase, partial [Desulfobacterales bacterium]
MAFKEKVGVFETYDRARTGPKVDEDEWDKKLTYQKANQLKEKYKLEFDRAKIIPTDTDMIDRLFQAGLEMLVDTGIYCMDTGRVIKYTEDEVMMAVAGAPRELTLGEGRDARKLAARSFDDSRPPLCQGGPTGAPVSEDIFVAMHEAYAREPLVDTIVNGVLSTINGREAK